MSNSYQKRVDAQKSRVDDIRAELEDRPDLKKSLDQQSENLGSNKVPNPGKDVPEKKK